MHKHTPWLYIYFEFDNEKDEKKMFQIIFGLTTAPPTKTETNNYLKNVTRCGVCFVGEINVILARTSSRVLFFETKNTHTH